MAREDKASTHRPLLPDPFNAPDTLAVTPADRQIVYGAFERAQSVKLPCAPYVDILHLFIRISQTVIWQVAAHVRIGRLFI
jgi:hypothetical protein